jgi:outer membrane murein-binding lipoprotein Lpp
MTKLLGGAAIAPLLLVGMSLSSAQAQSTSDSAQLQAEINALKAQMKALEAKMKTTQTKQAQQAQQLQASYPPTAPYEPPIFADKKFHMNGITITPGGFLAAEGLWRSRDQGTDITDVAFGNIPAQNTELSRMNETRFTARQSRVSLLVEGAINPSLLASAYGEVDFLGAANTANSNESNSYNPRFRVLYGTLDYSDMGLHLLAGQSWSLATLQGEGMAPRKEVIPTTIDAQYVAGFTWARQPGIRLTENFGNGFSVAVSAEQSQTTGCPSLAAGAGFAPAPAANTVASGFPGIDVTCAQQSSGGGLLNSETTYSINHIPDIIGKVAWDPIIADRKIHLEAMGIYADLYDQVDNLTGAAINGTYTNRDTTAWGVGGGFTAQIMPQFLDVQGSVLAGRGIGRYGSGQLNDATLNPDGSLRAIPEIMFLGGATVHATPWLDLYAYGGLEEQNATFTAVTAATQVGIGDVAAINNTGCFTVGGTCTAQTKNVWEVTAGFWDKVYSGVFGSVRVGVQYSYIQRDFFPGTVGLPAGSAPLAANTNENVVMASFRYYPFDNPAPAPIPVIAKY